MPFVSATCPWCGGILEKKPDGPWVCTSCGRGAVHEFAATKSGGSCENLRDAVIEVTRGDDVVTYPFEGSATLRTEYRRRSTLADPFPMNLLLILPDETVTVAEEIPNVGAGEMKIKLTQTGIKLSKSGHVTYDFKNTEDSTSAEIIIADVKITIIA